MCVGFFASTHKFYIIPITKKSLMKIIFKVLEPLYCRKWQKKVPVKKYGAYGES